LVNRRRVEVNRREFTKGEAVGVLGLAASRMGGRIAGQSDSPQIATTVGDFHWQNAGKQNAGERDQAVLVTVKSNRIRADLFVIGSNAESEEGKELLRAWDDAGHRIGNHTYSHRPLMSQMTAETYEKDILRAEEVLKNFKQFRRIFRYPLLKEGD